MTGSTKDYHSLRHDLCREAADLMGKKVLKGSRWDEPNLLAPKIENLLPKVLLDGRDEARYA